MSSRLLAAIVLFGSLFLSANARPTEPAMRMLMQFDSQPSEPRWIAVNDGVLEFTGTLSLANNGGFSSVRSVGRDFDLSDASAVVLRVRGDGRRYQLRLATDARYRGLTVTYGASFDTTAGKWMEVRVPLASLEPSVRGTRLQGPPLDPAHVREIGLLIADKREGAFALVVDWIAVE